MSFAKSKRAHDANSFETSTRIWWVRLTQPIRARVLAKRGPDRVRPHLSFFSSRDNASKEKI
jgi:hypothetical protein